MINDYKNPSLSEIEKGTEDHPEHYWFAPMECSGNTWPLDHLHPFGFYKEIPLNKQANDTIKVTIVVLFSCHCFTHQLVKDPRAEVPPEEIYKNDKDTKESGRRVFNKERCDLSKGHLISIIKSLSTRKIVVASPGENYVVHEKTENGAVKQYGVFFKTVKSKQKNRIVLIVQSAYLRELTQRHKEAKKVKFETLLKAALEGRVIKP